MEYDGQVSRASLPPDAAELVSRMLDDLDLGLDATMVARAAEGGALLDEVAAQLARSRTRVLRVAAPSEGGLTLAGLLTRLRPAVAGVEQAPEQRIEALTRLDPGCDRIALLVSNAETLERSALRAIQLAAAVQPKLRLVLVGTAALLTALDHPELSVLHSRLNRQVDPQDDDEDETTAPMDASPARAASLGTTPANNADRSIKIAVAAMSVLAAAGLGIVVSNIGVGTAPARTQAESLAHADSQGPPQTVAASDDVLAPPPQFLAASPPALTPTEALPNPPAPPSPALVDAARAPTGPQFASIPPAAPIQPAAPATLAQPEAAGQQAALPPLLKRREPTPRHPTPPAPRYASRPSVGIDQSTVDQAHAHPTGRTVADARPLRLPDHPSDRRPEPHPPVRYEPRQQQGDDAWPIPADEPGGTIGIYSGGPGGIRYFHRGS